MEDEEKYGAWPVPPEPAHAGEPMEIWTDGSSLEIAGRKYAGAGIFYGNKNTLTRGTRVTGIFFFFFAGASEGVNPPRSA